MPGKKGWEGGRHEIEVDLFFVANVFEMEGTRWLQFGWVWGNLGLVEVICMSLVVVLVGWVVGL